jgi:hypothetical protein
MLLAWVWLDLGWMQHAYQLALQAEATRDLKTGAAGSVFNLLGSK